MKCALCNKQLVEKKESIEFDSQSLGKISVPNLKFLECEGCGDKLLSTKEANKAALYITRKESELINRLPIGEFVSANEAAALLGITKQAFSKHPKIKRGFIYFTQIGDRKFYHKKSVELFKEKGNGKFILTRPEDIIDIPLIDSIVGAESGVIYMHEWDIGLIENKYENESFGIGQDQFTTNATSFCFTTFAEREDLNYVHLATGDNQ
jgi:hypothetical protein